MRIAVAQPRCAPYDVAANARAHADAVRSAGAQVVVFPELSLTGYELDAPPVAPGDARLDPLVSACARTGALALAGAPVREAADHIAMLAVTGDGATVAYRKMWPGGDEPVRFAPGDAPAVLEVDGWRLGLAICRDTGIAEHAARTVALGVDVYAAAVLEHEKDAELPAERARRIAGDHGVWVAVAGFAGPTGGGYAETAGRSGVWAPGGRLVRRTGRETGAVIGTDLRRPPPAPDPAGPRT
jgi:predicted amidohydrolase